MGPASARRSDWTRRWGGWTGWVMGMTSWSAPMRRGFRMATPRGCSPVTVTRSVTVTRPGTR
jgi:hypothetical protein